MPVTPRDLVAKTHRTWAVHQPESLTSHVLRTLLWDIDHPAPEDQTPAVYRAWLDQVEPRYPDGSLLRPEFVAELKRRCLEIHATTRPADTTG